MIHVKYRIAFFMIYCAAIVGDIKYSLTNLPTKDSSLVYLVPWTGWIDDKALTNTFNDLGIGANMGFYTAVAYKTEFKDKAQSIRNDIISLQVATILTFQKFEEKSNEALKKLHVAFEHISDDREGEAHIILLDEVGSLANDLAKEARDIELQASTGRDKVSSLLKEIYSSRGELKNKKNEIEKQEQRLQAQKARTETDLRNAQAAAAESQRQADQARYNADHEKRKKEEKCEGWKFLICTLARAINWNLVEEYEIKERFHRREAEHHLARAREQQQKAARAFSQLQQLANKLNEAREKIKSNENIAQGLQDIICNYNGLTVTLQTFSTAWEDVSNNCADLKKRVTDKAAVAAPSFQKQAITLYAQWLSLGISSKSVLNEIKPIKVIEETITPKDAQNKIKKD
ncbi:PREDICTED: uncharacterized protein LOC109586962 [Amphimedon queenslandica]|uniref:Dynein heavy chain coiled coil stalk domain-containing protein n=1 Tax=Amphimedon queenslandica TaxID=400682 RepID=A0A1X7TND2_AMPQE|nr:PREDICTED: uncharacterized protein LOC109586962 [Amphimedon queenslandica]|eukprot:XP_019858732.1 PREDICTED: uncharacterized protein LOC109586962 [Amphimedon queenslandica]